MPFLFIVKYQNIFVHVFDYNVGTFYGVKEYAGHPLPCYVDGIALCSMVCFAAE
jgi:hypothetical protein